ncbi:Uncharacterised protein [BD1-7 clade bacterium]|uniref:Uncharacterized protein n=1 Tax=BD1-7 clade bacterium TaxID=2029982 RepID=A0A5S9PBA6_9GAMM|nr:Uncharacterised protein [BD1-7 clade bacterium]
MKRICVMFSLITFLLACSEDGNDDKSDLLGWWKLTATDSYLRISADGKISVFDCSVNDGYREVHSVQGVIENGTLTIQDNEPVVWNTKGEMLLDLDTQEAIAERANDLPSICTGNAIDIVSFSPETASVGISTQFSISFDYRLSTTSAAVILFGITSADDGTFSPAKTQYEVLQAETGSGELVADITLVPLAENAPYSIDIVMFSGKIDDGSFEWLASDRKTLNVTAE